MNRPTSLSSLLPAATLGLALAVGAGPAPAAVDGVTGTSFAFDAQVGRVTTPDGSNLLMWGYACTSCASPDPNNVAQYPGPTLIVNQGDTVTVTLSNHLTLPPTATGAPVEAVPNVSIVFPGEDYVTASGGVVGSLTREARPAGTTAPAVPDVVTYTFHANRPGTFMYHSGTRQDLELEMGLFGAIVVRPSGYANRAYADAATAFDREFLFVTSEMDPSIHLLIDAGLISQVDNTTWYSTYWFFNGRAFPDTLAEANLPWMPNQPYNTAPRMHPGEQVLIRTVAAGREVHPFHHHGNHSRIVARDGRLLESAPGAGPDRGYLVYSIPTYPGETFDSIWSWTGEGVGWDLYGHKSTDPLQPGECVFGGVVNRANPLCDHGKPIPVTLPDQLSLHFGEFWSGSPYLGQLGALPPGQGRNNTTGGFFFMWHSHTEKEIVNNNVFPGGMLTMGVIEPPSVAIP